MRILVFQTAYLGDAVLSLPLLATLRDSFPKAGIDCCVQPAWAPVIEASGLVDSIVPFDKRNGDSGILGSIALAMRLRKEKYDVVLCPHPSFRSGWILKLAGIPKRVGFSNASGRFFFSELLKRDPSRHEALRTLSLCSALGIPEDRWVLRSRLEPPDGADPEAVLAGVGLEEGTPGYVGVHPGSVWATKRWTAEHFSTVCKMVAKQGIPVVVFGTESERLLVEEVVQGAGHTLVHKAVGLSLSELMAAFSKMVCYVSNDSGPMHIAAAMGKPVVAIFGSTVPSQGYAPWSDSSAIVEMDRLDCRPCGSHGHDVCPLEHFDCMKRVRPFSVLLAVRVITGFFDGSGFQRALFRQKRGI